MSKRLKRLHLCGQNKESVMQTRFCMSGGFSAEIPQSVIRCCILGSLFIVVYLIYRCYLKPMRGLPPVL